MKREVKDDREKAVERVRRNDGGIMFVVIKSMIY